MSVEKPLVPVEVATDGGPITVFVAILTVERREEHGIFGPVVGLDTHIHLASDPKSKPEALFLSRLVGEVRWTADAHFGANGFPFFSHGFGARYTIPQVLSEEIAALVDDEARRAGLVEAIDQSHPLVLPGSQG